MKKIIFTVFLYILIFNRFWDGKEVHRKMEKPVPPVYIKPENNGNFKFHGEVMYEDEL